MTSKTNTSCDKGRFQKETAPVCGSLCRHSWRTPVVMDLDFHETEGKTASDSDGFEFDGS